MGVIFPGSAVPLGYDLVCFCVTHFVCFVTLISNFSAQGLDPTVATAAGAGAAAAGARADTQGEGGAGAAAAAERLGGGGHE